LAFSRIPGRETPAKYYAQLSVASGAERVGGHGGAFFNYLWTPLGANSGGEEASAAYFRQAQWHLDLARTWEGDFFYNDYATPGYNGKTFKKANLHMNSPCLLTYAMRFRQLAITGRGWNKSNRLSHKSVDEAFFAGSYSPEERSIEQLITDLASFSAVVRNRASAKLAVGGENKALRRKLESISMDDQHPSRVGVIQALGEMGDPDSAKVLVTHLNDKNHSVRDAAILAFGLLPPEVQSTQVDLLLKMAGDLKRLPFEVHKTDPVNTGLIALTTILFEKKGLLGKSLASVKKYSSREQLYQAIRAVASLPSGGMRGKLKFVFGLLSKDDVRALSKTLLDLIYIEAPADAMFAENIRSESMKLLIKHRFMEGIKASVELFKVGKPWTQVEIINQWSYLGSSIDSLAEIEEIKELLENYGDKKYMKECKKALNAIENSKKKKVTFTTFSDMGP